MRHRKAAVARNLSILSLTTMVVLILRSAPNRKEHAYAKELAASEDRELAVRLWARGSRTGAAHHLQDVIAETYRRLRYRAEALDIRYEGRPPATPEAARLVLQGQHCVSGQWLLQIDYGKSVADLQVCFRVPGEAPRIAHERQNRSRLLRWLHAAQQLGNFRLEERGRLGAGPAQQSWEPLVLPWRLDFTGYRVRLFRKGRGKVLDERVIIDRGEIDSIASLPVLALCRKAEWHSSRKWRKRAREVVGSELSRYFRDVGALAQEVIDRVGGRRLAWIRGGRGEFRSPFSRCGWSLDPAGRVEYAARAQGFPRGLPWISIGDRR